MTEEQAERLRQIRERWSQAMLPEQLFTSHVKQDIDFLLSLYDSQTVSLQAADNRVGLVSGFGAALRTKATEDTATAMRDKCVEKIQEIANAWRRDRGDPARMVKYDAAQEIILELLSLTFDTAKKQ